MSWEVVTYPHCLLPLSPSLHDSNIFSFDPSAVKKVSVSTDSLDKAMQDPVLPTTSVVTATEPSSTEVSVRRRDTDRRRRYSAPPSERRHTRDSVGSLDYLSESQGGCGLAVARQYVC